MWQACKTKEIRRRADALSPWVALKHFLSAVQSRPTKQLIWSFFHLATSLCFLSAPWSLTLEWWNVSVEPSCCSFYIFSFTFGGPTSSIQQTVSFLTDFLVFLLKAHTKTSTFTHNVNFHPPTSGYPIHTLDIPSLDQCTETDDHSHSWAL